jgi:ABC-type multidrug transport system ATPase subunit
MLHNPPIVSNDWRVYYDVMKEIILDNIGKRFRYEWIFKGVSQTFQQGENYAILGPNGSGKSTLMKILSGHLTPSMGAISFSDNEKKVLAVEDIYKHISYAAPYIDLIEEMTLEELIGYYFKFKTLRKGLIIKDLVEILGFQKSINKQIRFFSSGMKQRLKLVLAICADTPILLLDEPTTNLDAQGVAWYQQLISENTTHSIPNLPFGEQNTEGPPRLIIVASNIEHDYHFCSKKINILEYK